MIRLAYSQRSLVEVLLPDSEKLWDPVLGRIDAELEDESLLDVMVEALARRHPLSPRRGRPGTPATVVLRMLVLKHLYDWSFDECEREVRANLVYRAFCRMEGERVPDAKTLIRLAQVLDGPTLKQLVARLVAIAGERRVIRGRRLRVDTTVVETKVGKVLDKFDLSIDDLHKPFHELAGERARDEVPEGVRKALGEFRGTVARGRQPRARPAQPQPGPPDRLPLRHRVPPRRRPERPRPARQRVRALTPPACPPTPRAPALCNRSDP